MRQQLLCMLQSRRKQVYLQDDLVRGLIHASSTKTNLPDSSLAEATLDHYQSANKFLEENVLPSALTMFPNSVSQFFKDSVTCHIARSIKVLEDHQVKTKGAFTPVPFGAVVPKQGAFPPKGRFVWTYGNTAIELACFVPFCPASIRALERLVCSENRIDTAAGSWGYNTCSVTGAAMVRRYWLNFTKCSQILLRMCRTPVIGGVARPFPLLY